MDKIVKIKEIPEDTLFNILDFLVQNQNSYIHPVLIKEELDIRKIRYGENLCGLLNKMSDAKLLKSREIKSSQENLYKISEIGIKYLTEKGKKSS